MTYNQLTTEKFIKRAKAIHGDKYDYSETEYINMKTKVKIRCQKHGVFELIAGNHIYSLEHDVPILIIPYKSSEGSVEYLITRFLYNLHLVKEIVE